jgi:hypothetical protein
VFGQASVPPRLALAAVEETGFRYQVAAEINTDDEVLRSLAPDGDREDDSASRIEFTQI